MSFYGSLGHTPQIRRFQVFAFVVFVPFLLSVGTVGAADRTTEPLVAESLEDVGNGSASEYYEAGHQEVLGDEWGWPKVIDYSWVGGGARAKGQRYETAGIMGVAGHTYFCGNQARVTSAPVDSDDTSYIWGTSGAGSFSVYDRLWTRDLVGEVPSGGKEDTVSVLGQGSGGSAVSGNWTNELPEVSTPLDMTTSGQLDETRAFSGNGTRQREDSAVRTENDSVAPATDTESGIPVPDEAPNFVVSIQSTSSPIELGETLDVYATVSNVGNASGTQEIHLKANGLDRDYESVTLSAGEKESVVLHWMLASSDVGSPPVYVISDDDAAVRVTTVTRSSGTFGG